MAKGASGALTSPPLSRKAASSLRATQTPLKGQTPHCGCPEGTHTVAPSSIIAWLKSPGLSLSRNSEASDWILFATAPFFTSPGTAQSRLTCGGETSSGGYLLADKNSTDLLANKNSTDDEHNSRDMTESVCMRPAAVHTATHHAYHVAVHRRLRPAKGDGRDSSRGVRPDAGDLPQSFCRARHGALQLRHDVLCPFQQEPCTPVVTQPGPHLRHRSRELCCGFYTFRINITAIVILAQRSDLVDLFERRSGQRSDVGPPLHPLLEIRYDRLHPRLLQHDLGDPNLRA